MIGFLIVLLTVGCCINVAKGVKSSCESFEVREGKDTNITCHFEEDISEIQRDVKVYHDTNAVLTIAWIDGRPDIHSKEGYKFEGSIDKSLTVDIPRAKSENGGKYACHVVLSLANEASPCLLVVSGNNMGSTIQYNKSGCLEKTTGEINVNECYTSFYVSLSLLTVSLIINICTCFNIMKRKCVFRRSREKKCFWWNNRKSNQRGATSTSQSDYHRDPDASSDTSLVKKGESSENL